MAERRAVAHYLFFSIRPQEPVYRAIEHVRLIFRQRRVTGCKWVAATVRNGNLTRINNEGIHEDHHTGGRKLTEAYWR